MFCGTSALPVSSLSALFVWILSQEPCFIRQPIANDPGALIAIIRPMLREGMVCDFIGLDAECLSDHGCGMVAIVIVYSLLK
jgi:hypothetical protein